MLMIVSAIPVMGTLNIEKNNKNIKPSSTSTIAWSEDFDSYEAGSLLHGQGGWEAWDLTTELSPYVRDVQCFSSPNSVELTWIEEMYWSDIIHMFYGVNSGQWIITAWWFLPETFVGVSNFVLHNKYEVGVHDFPRDNSVIIQADSFFDNIRDYRSGGTLPMIKNEWVELRVEIDFDSDICDTYYNGTLLGSAAWTNTGGQKNLACIDLCDDGSASNASYFDDITLEGDVSEDSDLYCEGEITLNKVEPDSVVESSFIVENMGAEGTLLDWEIESYPPDWGEWTFEPNEGTDIESFSPITINVEIVAPDEKNEEFIGEIRIVNSEDSSDYEIISVSLTTPKNKSLNFNLTFLVWLFEHFPNAFPILRYILE
jgi:hypothetical protein